MSKCSVCSRQITNEDAPILTMSAYGNPKYLCDECAADIEAVMGDREYSSIKQAFDRLAEKMSDKQLIDETANESLQAILDSAAVRAERIKAGTYDFSEDESESESAELDEIPEDMLESEEDVKLDERDEQRAKKLDKFINIGFAVAFVGALIFFLVKMLG